MKTALLLCLLVALPVAAQTIDDPTRPPVGFAADGMTGSGSMGLTSVILPKKGRAAAVIDGQLVELGATVRGAKLVAISEGRVILDGPDGRERLYLTPDVDKKVNVNKAAVRRNKE